MRPGARCLLPVLLLWPALVSAQSDLRTRTPVGLFRDMQADTVTSDLFNHFAPTPHVAFHVTEPVPGEDIFADTRGMAAIDFDNDGDQDVVLAGPAYAGEPGARLLRNNSDGTFAVVESSGLPRRLFQVAAADVDNDGWTDLIGLELQGGRRYGTWQESKRQGAVGGAGIRKYVSLVWLANDRGRGFVVRPIPRVTDRVRDPDAVDLFLHDVDQDGWVDVLLLVLNADSRNPVTLLRGGPGGFRAGPPFATTGEKVYGMGLLDPTDRGQFGMVLFRGNPFTFPPDALDRWDLASWPPRLQGKLPLPPGPDVMYLVEVDVNNDGRFDLFGGVTDLQGGRNRMLIWQPGEQGFVDRGRDMGLWAGYNYTAAPVWGDWDQDTFLDLLQPRFFNEDAWTESSLYLNQAGERFVNITARADAPLGPGSVGGLAVDADADGDLDILLGHATLYPDRVLLEQTRVQLLRNDSRTGSWLQVELVGTRSNRSALGARAAVHLGAQAVHRQVAGGVHWGVAQPPLAMHFGLGGAAEVDSITVRWPDGAREVFPGCASDQQVTLTEGAGRGTP